MGKEIKDIFKKVNKTGSNNKLIKIILKKKIVSGVGSKRGTKFALQVVLYTDIFIIDCINSL